MQDINLVPNEKHHETHPAHFVFPEKIRSTGFTREGFPVTQIKLSRQQACHFLSSRIRFSGKATQKHQSQQNKPKQKMNKREKENNTSHEMNFQRQKSISCLHQKLQIVCKAPENGGHNKRMK